MVIKRILLLVVLLTTYMLVGFGQSTNGDLVVERENGENLSLLLKRINLRIRDTGQVELLLKISHILWYNRHGRELTLDSCDAFAKQAYRLSADLQYVEGATEAGFMLCRAAIEKGDILAARRIMSKSYGAQRARLLLLIGEYYAFKFQPGEPQYRLALPLILEGIQSSQKIKSGKWMDQGLLLLGKYQFKKGDSQAGKKAILTIIAKYEKSQDYLKTAHFWSELALYMPENNKTYHDIIKSYERAIHYFMLANDKKNAAYSLRDLAMVNGNHNQLDSAEKHLMRCVALLKDIDEEPSPTTYAMIGDFYRFTGQYEKAVIYALQGIKSAKSERSKDRFYFLLGNIYELRGEYEKSLHYLYATYNSELKVEGDLLHVYAYRITNVITASGKPKKALSYLTNFLREHPSTLVNRKQLFCHSFIDIYSKLGDYKTAEKYCIEMLNLNKAVEVENGRNQNNGITLEGCGAYFLAGRFYTDWKKYDKGGKYLKKSLEDPQYFDYQQQLDTYRLLAKTDSASGNFRSAFKNFQVFKRLNDSVSNASTSRRISELNIRFETEQQLNDIKLLKNNQRMQQAELQKSAMIRNLTVGGAVLLLIVAIIFILGYRNKKRISEELRFQRDEIDRKNAEMRILLNKNEKFLKEKDEHIKEKDWLLKEIHHRVKNNLQIVISLLNSQSKYLEDPDTLTALQGSQNRIFSISLIHQKLYQDDNLAGISFQTYIKELTDHLSNSLNTDEKVYFDLKADDVLLDVSQAVPLGLITNEAITNAMKHAFKGQKEGIISISFLKEDNDWLSLMIADNGIGLPQDYNIEEADSLGITLMRGLSDQLKAEFEFTGWPAVRIRMRWKKSKLQKSFK
jgi:two-component sensor histidine kinase